MEDTDLPVEHHRTGLCQGKVVETKTVSLFNGQELFSQGHKGGVFPRV